MLSEGFKDVFPSLLEHSGRNVEFRPRSGAPVPARALVKDLGYGDAPSEVPARRGPDAGRWYTVKVLAHDLNKPQVRSWVMIDGKKASVKYVRGVGDVETVVWIVYAVRNTGGYK